MDSSIDDMGIAVSDFDNDLDFDIFLQGLMKIILWKIMAIIFLKKILHHMDWNLRLVMGC